MLTAATMHSTVGTMARCSDLPEPGSPAASNRGLAEGWECGQVSLCNPLAAPDWDEQLPDTPNTGAFHTQAWARVLHEAYGYTPCYLVADRDGSRQAVAPLMEVRSWLTGVRGVSLPFSDACPVLDASGKAYAALMERAGQLARERGWRHVEWRDEREPAAGAPPYASYVGHELDLTSDGSKLEEGMHPSLRRAVRKAERAGVSIRFSTEPGDLGHYYELHCRTRQRQGMPPQPCGFFRLVHKHLMSNGLGEVALAWHDGRPVSGAVFFRFGGMAHYKFGATDLRWQSLRGSNLLMACAIKRFANQGFKVFSFGRTEIGHEGLRRFKRSFGAREVSLAYYRMDVETGRYRAGPRGRGARSTSVFRWLPLWVGRMAGRIGYRHLG